ncbi:uncharacterized protein LOC142655869 [Rhinoderma darwinii]|uniref:uncharacterized protein LOC142655869 n=1 Tax=Rhinoderma darwinii TaxID=43563 RepID=UPI003F663B99
MIRFLLLLLLLPGAELIANDTYEVETVTTTLGSQFNMAVTTQTTLLRKPSLSRAPTKKTTVHATAPKNGEMLHPPPMDSSVTTDKAQPVQGGGIMNTTSWKHKNSTHVYSTQNITEWHPTKIPVTSKSHSQSESSIRKPIIKKVTTPPSKMKSVKNPSARYQSPPHVHHKNATMKPGMGHFHHSNTSAGAAELSKSHRAVTPPLRNSLKLGQREVSPVGNRVKHLPLGSQLHKQLKDKANSTSEWLSTVINNSSKSDTHNINHITHPFPNSSFVHGKKTILYELNSLNTSEHVWSAQNMSMVPQIDRRKHFSTPGLLKGVNLPGVRQSRVTQEFNAEVNIRVPDRDVLYNHTKQNSRDTTQLSGLGQDGTIRLQPDKNIPVGFTEPVGMGIMVHNGTKITSNTQSSRNIQSRVGAAAQVQTQVWTTTQSEIPAHNNVEQQHQPKTELTTGGHIHHNQTHIHRHHKHSEHQKSDNTVSQHTVTSLGRLSGTNRHHLKHLHNFTHRHEHNEHWVQHQRSSTQVSLDQLSRQGHPSPSPIQGEETSFREGQATVLNGSDVLSTQSHLRENISEPETTTQSPLKPFATIEPKLTTQSLQNRNTESRFQRTSQTQRGLTTLHEPLTDNNSSPHDPKEKHFTTPSTPYNTTEEFQTELDTQTQPKLTSHQKTEVTGHSSQEVATLMELTTQSLLKLVKETQTGEPTKSQPDLTTRISPYLSTQTYPDLHTETQSINIRTGASTEPLSDSVRNNLLSPTIETHKVTEPPLTTRSPPDLVTSKNFDETQKQTFSYNQYNESEPSTAPRSRTETSKQTEQTRNGSKESLTQKDSTTQTDPIVKGISESSTPITSIEPIRRRQTELFSQKEPTTKEKTEPITHEESITRTELITKTTTGWLEKTETVSPFQTEPTTTNSNSTLPIQKEMTTESYTDLPTKTEHIRKGTTEPTSEPIRVTIAPSRRVPKNETESATYMESITTKHVLLNQTTTMGYGRDERESTKQAEPTSKVPLNPSTTYGHVSPTHKVQSKSTQTQPDLGARTYTQHATRAKSEFTPTGDPDMQTAKKPLTSLPEIPGDIHFRSHTIAGPRSALSNPSLTGGHQSQDGLGYSGTTLSSTVQTFYPTTSHTSEEDHVNWLTTVRISENEASLSTKTVTSPQSNTLTTQTLSELMSVQPGRDRIFIVDEQQPVYKVQTINVTYKMIMTHHAACERLDSCKPLLLQELTSAYKSTPGFDKIEILNVTVAGTALEYKVLFSVRPGSLMSAAQELILSKPSMLFGSSENPFAYRLLNISLTDNHADPCSDWFACPRSFQCVPLRMFSALCLSPCHSIFCHNNGICIHRRGQDPECQCPIGRDFWYMGQTCDYRMTHHRLAAIACAVVFCIIICAAAAVFVLVRRFQTQILQQKVAQTQSSYRRFSRFDDVPTHFWCPSQTWLTASASLNSLDNPAFSSSEEVFPLQALGSCVCGCQDGVRKGPQTNQPQQPAGAPPRLETSCSSVNDLMIDSGKASDVSVCSWPMEPIHWTPFPILHQLSLQSPFHARRPHSYFEGMELVNTERSWTA